MNTLNFNNEEKFKEIVIADKPGLVPDTGISERLNYHFLIKNSTRKIQSNSFTGLFLWLLSFKNIALKTGIAVLFLSFLLFKTQFSGNPSTNTGDTCSNHVLVVDTNFIYKDTCKY